MKRIAIALLAGTALVSLSQVASAADMAVKAAPPPPPAPTWTGVYVGVHAGAAWQSAPQWTATDPNAPANGFFPSYNLTDHSGLGGVGGLQAGYNWQFAPMWVVGVEGDISWASLADHRSTNLFTSALVPIPTASVQMSANTQWLASARAKFGFVGWNTLWYVTGGGAWANIEYAATSTLVAGPPALTTAATSFNTTKSGWVLGGGAEWQATSHILIRAEYLYYSLNNGNTGSALASGPAAGAFPLPLGYNWEKYNVQVARIAASYKF
jgi:outer membrane immunogenic protein